MRLVLKLTQLWRIHAYEFVIKALCMHASHYYIITNGGFKTLKLYVSLFLYILYYSIFRNPNLTPAIILGDIIWRKTPCGIILIKWNKAKALKWMVLAFTAVIIHDLGKSWIPDPLHIKGKEILEAFRPGIENYV